MTSSRKSLIQSKKKNVKGSKPGEPETAAEHLEAGVRIEEAGEKWRAGDAAKALRFFLKAISQYATGLQAFPDSFDLAYNKARLQFDIAQQPRLLKQLPDTPVNLLRQATESHIFALRLDSSNTDALFNHAQVYASLAEALLESPSEFDTERVEASQLLHQALDILDQCFKVQHQSFAEANEVASQGAPSSPGGSPSKPLEGNATADINEEEEEVWASVIEPVTEGTLLDTCMAQLECLKILCSLQLPSTLDELALIETAYTGTLHDRIQLYAPATDRRRDGVLGQAGFLFAFANARFRLLWTDVRAFDSEANSAVALLEDLPEVDGDAEALCIAGDGHIECSTSLEERTLQVNETSREAISAVNRLCWTHITKALGLYTAASKISNVANLARIHISRGDCELLRTRLGDEPFKYELAEKSQATMIRNAGVYYTAANKVLQHSFPSPEIVEDKAEAGVKFAVIAAYERNDFNDLLTLYHQNQTAVTRLLDEMREQGLIRSSAWTKIKHVTGMH